MDCDKFNQCDVHHNCLLCVNQGMFKNRRGLNFEKRTEKAINRKRCRRTAASGANWKSPGDIKDDQFMISCKSTSKKSIRLEQNWLDEIDEIAQRKGKYPAIALEIEGHTSWIALKMDDFIDLILNKGG